MNVVFPTQPYDYQKPPKEVLVDLINLNNPNQDFTVDSFVWGLPIPNTNPAINCNTELQLSGNPVLSRSGVVSIYYNRTNIFDILNETDVPFFPTLDKLTLSDIIPQFNELYGLNLVSEDYTDQTLPVVTDVRTPRSTPLHITADSLLFTGSAIIKLGNWVSNASEAAVANTTIYVVDKVAAAADGVWVQKFDAALKLQEGWKVNSGTNELFPSDIDSHAIVSNRVMAFAGSLNYENDLGPVTGQQAVVFVDGSPVDITAILDAHPDVNTLVPAPVVYAFRKGHNENHLLVGIYNPDFSSAATTHYTALMDVSGAAPVLLGLTTTGTKTGEVDNLDTAYMDLMPVTYGSALEADSPAYVKVRITSFSILLTFFDKNLTPLSGVFPTLAIDPAETDTTFYAKMQPTDFTFSGLVIEGVTTLTLNMKFSHELYDVSDWKAYTAPHIKINGTRVVPADVVADNDSVFTSWHGAVELTAAGPVLPSVFKSLYASYMGGFLNRINAAGKATALIRRRGDGSAYSGLRQCYSPIYNNSEPQIYPWGRRADGAIIVRDSHDFIVDPCMYTLCDAVAEEVFEFEEGGVQVSRGFIWHVVGYAATNRNDFGGYKPSALTYTVFDSGGNCVVTRQASLAEASFGNEDTLGLTMHNYDDTTVWMVRPDVTA